MTLFYFLILLAIVGALYVAYETSAGFAQLLDIKVLKLKGKWALTDEETLETKCMALVTRQLTDTHYELKVYEEHKLRTVILEANKFELIKQY
jgi:hypothetical protein